MIVIYDRVVLVTSVHNEAHKFMFVCEIMGETNENKTLDEIIWE